jgi:hypothetical protein
VPGAGDAVLRADDDVQSMGARFGVVPLTAADEEGQSRDLAGRPGLRLGRGLRWVGPGDVRGHVR